MKLYITNYQDGISGYTTISPILGHNIRELSSELVANAECTEILAPNIIDYIPVTQLLSTLQSYVSKLRHGGVIKIGGTDLFMATLQIAKRELSVNESNQVLFGGLLAHEAKSGLVGINDISGILEGFGLRITGKSLNGIEYLVEAKRD